MDSDYCPSLPSGGAKAGESGVSSHGQGRLYGEGG